jgi:hypothetical protein
MSVIYVTSRLGGFDMLSHSLRVQQGIARKDWELIVVDDWFDLRTRRLDGLAGQVKHIRSRDNDYFDPCYANNLGLRQAEGELIVFVSDMQWFYPRFLADHWDVYQNFPGYTLSGYLDRYPIPKLKAELSPGLETAWSVFEHEFDGAFASEFFQSVEPVYRERKGGHVGVAVGPYFEIPGELAYFNVDSLPLSVVTALNGLDERFDGGYGVCDIDLGVRANLLGHKFVVSSAAVSCKLGIPGISGVLPSKQKPRARSTEDNRQIFNRRMEAIRNGTETIAVAEGYGLW